ncbi:hypothetical protein KGF54_004015 [Candida jiufengensis]|uniref:uncharacterized protein n=1 Tax=Candida jiufengensis TaxID=497108 RepID=UPI0022242C97|nr:uncharacterized protein KGF54_004015 [Candida jiufengensis]KAI5950941.1 hypothetical protein KGF54_004015 [Candida jiufengensis]
MNAKVYLQSYGWNEGEALQKGGLKKPILVKHKKDTKGLGHDTNNADMWWEKLFDGQLKNLQVENDTKNGEVSFKSDNESALKNLKKDLSPLYRMFVKGEGLQGTVGKTEHVKEAHVDNLTEKAAEEIDKLTHILKSTNGKRQKKNKSKDKVTKDSASKHKKEKKRAEKTSKEVKDKKCNVNKKKKDKKKDEKVKSKMKDTVYKAKEDLASDDSRKDMRKSKDSKEERNKLKEDQKILRKRKRESRESDKDKKLKKKKRSA